MSYQILASSSPVVREDILPGSLPSWNPHVSLFASLATIEGINGPATLPDPTGVPTGGALASGWRYPTNFNTVAGYPNTGYSEKRLFTPPAIVNSQPCFVEMIGVAVADQVSEDFSTCYDPNNFPGNTCTPQGPGNDFLPSGRGFPTNPDDAGFIPAGLPNAWGDMTLTLSNPAFWVPGNEPPPGIHRLHCEIDRNWQAYAVDSADPTWDALNGHVALRNLAFGTLIDVQGFVYWDPVHLTEASHNYSGWEIHPITAWKVH